MLNLFDYALRIFSLKAHCFAGNYLLFFGNPDPEAAWSCQGSNPGPSVSQPDVMVTPIIKNKI